MAQVVIDIQDRDGGLVQSEHAVDRESVMSSNRNSRGIPSPNRQITVATQSVVVANVQSRNDACIVEGFVGDAEGGKRAAVQGQIPIEGEGADVRAQIDARRQGGSTVENMAGAVQETIGQSAGCALDAANARECGTIVHRRRTRAGAVGRRSSNLKIAAVYYGGPGVGIDSSDDPVAAA